MLHLHLGDTWQQYNIGAGVLQETRPPHPPNLLNSSVDPDFSLVKNYLDIIENSISLRKMIQKSLWEIYH